MKPSFLRRRWLGSSQSTDAEVLRCRESPTRARLPITSRAWFFPALILLTPIFARACVSSPPRSIERERRPAASEAEEQLCFEEYSQCLDECEANHPNDPSSCDQLCYEHWELCLANDPASADEEVSCDPDAGYCGYDEDYDDSSTDWNCETDSSDDSYTESTDWSCGSSDDSSDDGGLDCSTDSSDDGDYEDDWGEDWGAGGDGGSAPLDLPE